MGSYFLICPGMTLLKASSRFLTYSNLVQVINITVNYINSHFHALTQINQSYFSHLIDIFIFTCSAILILIMRFGLTLILSLLLLVAVQTVEVSLDSIKGFFWATYDRNDDGVATV